MKSVRKEIGYIFAVLFCLVILAVTFRSNLDFGGTLFLMRQSNKTSQDETYKVLRANDRPLTDSFNFFRSHRDTASRPELKGLQIANEPGEFSDDESIELIRRDASKVVKFIEAEEERREKSQSLQMVFGTLATICLFLKMIFDVSEDGDILCKKIVEAALVTALTIIGLV